jgi:hypothetical protein
MKLISLPRTGPEDFQDDEAGRCSRCVRQNVLCERDKPVRPRGANPQRARPSFDPTTAAPNSSVANQRQPTSSEPPHDSAPANTAQDYASDAGFYPVQGSSADLEVLPDAAPLPDLALSSIYQPWAQMVGFLEAEPAPEGLPDPSAIDWGFLMGSLPTPGAAENLSSGASPTVSRDGSAPDVVSEVVPELSEEMAVACRFSFAFSSLSPQFKSRS